MQIPKTGLVNEKSLIQETVKHEELGTRTSSLLCGGRGQGSALECGGRGLEVPKKETNWRAAGASTCHSQMEEVLSVVSRKHLKVGLGECPVVKSTCFFWGGPKFGSLHSCQVSYSCP